MKLEIKDLSKSFDTKEAVQHVSFVVEEGEFLSILGPSGCGKTTLLRMLIGLIKPTSGHILKDGVDITNFKVSRRGMGFVFQNYALFENMSVLQNVKFALNFVKLPGAYGDEEGALKDAKLNEKAYLKDISITEKSIARGEAKVENLSAKIEKCADENKKEALEDELKLAKRNLISLKDHRDLVSEHLTLVQKDIQKAEVKLGKALVAFEELKAKDPIAAEEKARTRYTEEEKEKIARDVIEKMGLTEYINRKPYTLSGGQQQRVAIARTLALHPDVILFDEPMSALDVATRLSLRKELKKIQKEFNTTMIYITHDQEEAFAMSDKILVMDTAVAVQIGTPEEILKNPANDYVKTFVIDNLKTKIKSLKKYVNIAND